MALVTIDKDLCDREGACIGSCPHMLLLRGPDGFPVEREDAASEPLRASLWR